MPTLSAQFRVGSGYARTTALIVLLEQPLSFYR